MDRAQGYRDRVSPQLEEVLKTMNEARGHGMVISFQVSQPDAFGRQSLVSLEIMKRLC